MSEELQPRKRPISVHPFFVYTTLRVAILLLSVGLFYVVGFRDIMLIIISFLVAGVISFAVLNKWRDQMGERVGGYFTRMGDRIDDEEPLNAEDEMIAAREADLVETPAEPAPATVDLSGKKANATD